VRIDNNNNNNIIIIIIIIISDTAAGYGLLVSRGFLITHNDAPQSVGPLWTSDQLVAETSTWQHTTHTTNIHAPGGIRTYDRSRRTAVDLRLRWSGHWDRPVRMDTGVKYSNNEVRNQSLAFIGEVKNARSFVSSHPYAFKFKRVI
jgi:hypothetical protein